MILSLLYRFHWYLIIAMFNSFSSIFKALASRWRTSWHMTFSGKNLQKFLFSKLFVWCPIQDFIFSLADIFFSNFSPPRIRVAVGDRIFKNRKVEKKTSIGWETNIKHQQDWYIRAWHRFEQQSLSELSCLMMRRFFSYQQSLTLTICGFVADTYLFGLVE